MKKALILLILLINGPLVIFAQDYERVFSKAEEATFKSGAIFEKRFIKIGSVIGLLVQAVKVKDITNKVESSYLLFEYTQTFGNSSIQETKTASIDKEEIDALISTIKYMQSNVFTSSKTDTQYRYITNSGVTVGSFMFKGKWRGSIQLSRYDNNYWVSFTPEEFAVLLEFIETAKKALNE